MYTRRSFDWFAAVRVARCLAAVVARAEAAGERWREEKGFVLLELADLRGAAYVQMDGRGPVARKRLTPAVNPNGALVTVGDLVNLREVERLAAQGLTNR